MNKLEQAIEILMSEKGYYWCDNCGQWVEDGGRSECPFCQSYLSHFLSTNL